MSAASSRSGDAICSGERPLSPSAAECAALRIENELLRAEQQELLKECDRLNARLSSQQQGEICSLCHQSSLAAPSEAFGSRPRLFSARDVRMMLTVLENVLQEKCDAEIRHAAAVAVLQREIDAKVAENTQLLLTMDSIVTAMELAASKSSSTQSE